MANQHPIDGKEWHAVYGTPHHQEQDLGTITVEELAALQSHNTAGKDFLVVDVRRADCTSMIPGAINLPAHSLPVSLPTLLTFLVDIPLVIFHCNRSAGRGPRAAGWYADALQKRAMLAPDVVAQRVAVLQGGIVRWEEVYGTGGLAKRGQQGEGMCSVQL